MYRMLQFTAEEKARVEAQRIGIGGRLKGWVTYVPSLMSGGGRSAEASNKQDESSLADLWVDFLLQEAEKGSAANKSFDTAAAVTAASTLTPHVLTPKTQARIAENAAISQLQLNDNQPTATSSVAVPATAALLASSVTDATTHSPPSSLLWPPPAMQQQLAHIAQQQQLPPASFAPSSVALVQTTTNGPAVAAALTLNTVPPPLAAPSASPLTSDTQPSTATVPAFAPPTLPSFMISSSLAATTDNAATNMQ